MANLTAEEIVDLKGLTSEACNQVIDDRHFHHISRVISKIWKSLRPRLGLERSDQTVIEDATMGERASKFLDLWKQRKGCEATYLNLFRALMEIGHRGDVEEICNFLLKELSTSTG